MKAALPGDEQTRLTQLHALKIIDTIPEHAFDSLVNGVAELLDVPVVLISLIDERRQWFKAKVGLDICESSRDQAFCAHAILQDEPLVISDATLDARFSDNPFVTGDFHLRSYAGAPIVVNGSKIGTLCCLDYQSRAFTQKQINGLSAMANQVAILLECRLHGDRVTESQKLFSAAIHAMHDGFTIQNLEGEIMVANSRAGEILGLTGEQLRGRSSLDPRWFAIHEDLSPWPGDQHPTMTALRTGKECNSKVMGVRKPNGDLTWLLINAVPMFQPDEKRPHAVVCTFCDITEQKLSQLQIAANFAEIEHYSVELEKVNQEIVQANIQLKDHAMRDSLTGICNRRAFSERLDEEINQAGRRSLDCSVIVLDVDHFKSVNDKYGHQAGDQILCTFAEILSAEARKGELVARYGGEEFIVLLPGAKAEEAVKAAERFRKSLESAEWPFAKVSASLGVATLEPGMRSCDLINAADEALYVSKKEGRNRVTHRSLAVCEPVGI